MSQNPRDQLISSIEKQVDLFQATVGKANANTISIVSTILNFMGQTILSQFDEIQKLNERIINLEKKEPEKKE